MANDEMAKMVEETNTFLAAQVEPAEHEELAEHIEKVDAALAKAGAKPKTKKAKPAPETAEPKVGPCKRVHQIADAMKGKTRKEVIERAVAEGLNKGTVRVQLGHWAKKQPGGWTWPEPAAD